MHFQLLTIFPELFGDFSRQGLVSRALAQGRAKLSTIDLRDFALNTYGQVDDTPYGGGSGMVLRPEPAVAAIEAAKRNDPKAKVVLLTPRGKPFNQQLAHSLVDECRQTDSGLIFLCSRYEGVDQRIIDNWIDLELSIGDYIIMGGEVASMVTIEALTRLLPGVLGNPESIAIESFEQGLLEHPHYTKPAEFRGKSVPSVLCSGNHQAIEAWRNEHAIKDTIQRRPEIVPRRHPAGPLSIALIHHPVLGKKGEIITSSITNLDLHDIARSAKTYEVDRYYVAHPIRTLRRLADRISEHWATGHGFTYNPNRSEALSKMMVVPDFDSILIDIESRHGQLPKIITTSAKESASSVSFARLRAHLVLDSTPHLVLLGTGWGLAPELLERSDYQLEPIRGVRDFNHLSVRAAAAIILDRLLALNSQSLAT